MPPVATLVLGAFVALGAPAFTQAAAAGAQPGTCPAQATPPAAVGSLPPRLLILAEKARHLRLSTVRLSLKVILTAPEGTLSIEDVTSARVSPEESRSALTTTVTSAGKTTRETSRRLQIGGFVYSFRHTVGRRDDGRPWVCEHRESSHREGNTYLLTLSVDQLAKAESIAESSASIDGQPVTQFTAIFAPGTLPESALPMDGLEGVCSPGGSLTMSFTASGLPVLTSSIVEYSREGHGLMATTTIHLLATNFHFTRVKRPPANKTIGQARLRELESKRLTRSRKRRRTALSR